MNIAAPAKEEQAKTAKKPPRAIPENKSLHDLEIECLAHMAENGITFDGTLEKDGERHRFSIDKKKNKKDEFYACHSWDFKGRPYLRCEYGTWAGGLKEYTYKSYEGDNFLSEEDRRNFQRDEEQRRKKNAEQHKKEKEERRKKAQENWDQALENHSHSDHKAYLDKKQVKPYGVRFSADSYRNPVLVIPIRNVQGEIQAIQHIKADGEKRIHGIKKGNFHLLGQIKNDPHIHVTEGYATAASVHEATGHPVVVAFDCGNLEPVVANLKTIYPRHQITIAADDDSATPDNPGKTKAEEAAKKHNCTVVLPVFPESKKMAPGGKAYTDFNDLATVAGMEEVRRQLRKPIASASVSAEFKKLALNLSEKEEPCDCFSLDSFPKPLREYINAICETTEAHPIMVTSSVLATISGFMKHKLSIPEGEYFQTLYPNIQVLNVTKSGDFKTTALNKGAKLAREHSKAVTEKIKVFEEQIKSAADNQKKKDLEAALLAASIEDVILPNKITAEALLEHLSQGHAGVIYTSEFGAWLQNMDKSHNSDLKAIFTELYDVPQTYRYKTRTQGDFILEKPFFSICGVSTLAWLKDSLKPNDVSSGFFARFLIFTPPQKDYIPPALPRKTKPPDYNAELKIKETIENIGTISYTLSPEAKELFESIHASLYEMSRSYSERCQEILNPYLKRWSPYLLKLAMLIRPFEDPFSTEISDTAITAAMAILLPAIKSTAQLFEGELGESDNQRKCRIILEWICDKIGKTGAPVTRAMLLSSHKLEGGKSEYDYVLDTLIESGKLICKEMKPIAKSLYFPKGKEFEKFEKV